MKSVPEPAQLEIRIDEPRVARGSVDSGSVRVKIKWREAEADPPVIAALKKLSKPVDVEVLKRLDGEVELVLRSWRRTRFGPGKPTFLEMTRKTPGGLGPVRNVAVASERAIKLIRQYQPDFDSYAPEERAEFVMRTIERLNEVSRSAKKLIDHLQYAAPGRKAVPPLRDPERAVMATIISDVHNLSTLRIGEELGIVAPSDSDIKGENQTVRKMVHRGRLLLEQCFGTEGWNSKVKRMRAERQRWESIPGPKQQFYTLLAEERGTSPEDEEHTALEDGFDTILDEWVAAYEQGDSRQAMRIQFTDDRFDALRRL